LKKSKIKPLRRVYRQAIDVNAATAQELILLMEANNDLRNRAVEQAREWLSMEKGDPAKRPVTAFSFNNWLTDLRRENPALSETVRASDLIVSHARQTLVYVAGAYQSFFELKKRGDSRARTPKTYKWPCQLPLTWPAEAYSFQDGKLSMRGCSNGLRLELELPKYLRGAVEGKELVYVRLKQKTDLRRVPCKDGWPGWRIWELFGSDWRENLRELGWPREVEVNGEPINVAPYRHNSSTQWVLELTTSEVAPKPNGRRKGRIIALDIGAGNVAVVTSDGKEALIPMRRPDKIAKRWVSRIERCQEGLAKNSWEYDCLAKDRAMVFQQMENRQQDYQRKLAHALLSGVRVLVVGQTQIRLGLAQSELGSAKQHWGSQNTGYMARIVQFLENKAAETGVSIIKLPDPPREGALEEPDRKIWAAQQLLSSTRSLVAFRLPSKWHRIKWHIPQ